MINKKDILFNICKILLNVCGFLYVIVLLLETLYTVSIQLIYVLTYHTNMILLNYQAAQTLEMAKSFKASQWLSQIMKPFN